LNLVSPQGEVQSVQEQIPLGTQLHWYFPQDDSVDLAILPLAPPSDRYAYVQIPSSMIATSDMVKAGDVVVGDRVTFTGYFSNFPGQKRIEPIIRQGVIAMLAKVGSPVFVNVGGTHHGAFVMGENYLLLGLVSGYYPESVGFSVPAATVLTGEVRDNSGYRAGSQRRQGLGRGRSR
jgi:hypothetical protein